MKNLEALQEQLNQRMEECGGDFLEYLKKYNRHTLKLSLLNEQTGEEEWGEHFITFYNEDNAISHFSIVGKFIQLLTEEENRSWGYSSTDKEVVDNIINPIKDMLMGNEAQ